MASSVTVSIAPALAVQAEGATGTKAFTFTVTRSGDTGAAQTVEWIVTSDGPQGVDGLDFGGNLPAGTVSFAAGETSKTLTVLATGDGMVEPDEAFSVTLFNPSTGLTIGAGSASATIQNDDKAIVSIAAATAIMPEGNAGTTPLTFAITLDQQVATTQTVLWSISGSGVHPASASDFAGPFAAGAVTFAPGETGKTLEVDVVGDAMVEFDEGFTVTLTDASSGLVIGTATASGTILNDDKSLVSIAAQSASKPEGSSGMTAFTFAVTLDRPSASGQTIDWSVAGAGAHAANAADFGGTLPAGSVSFAAGETSKVVTVTVSADSAVEFDEGFVVSLSNASSGLAVVTSSATGTIQNDDKSVVSVAAQSGTAAEGTDVFTPFTFLVTLDRPGASGQTVAWSVAGSGAHPADATDFGGVLPTGFVSFAAGETSKVVTVWVSGDRAVEFDEGFTLALSTVTTDVVLGSATTASATIANDDRAVVSIAAQAASGPEGDGGPRVFTFTVSLDRAGVTPQSVDWSVAGSGNHAADAADFGGVRPSGTVSFAPGETSKIVSIAVSGDAAAEPDEAFVVTLSNATGGLAVGQATASGEIMNDDRPVASIAALSSEQAEGNAGTTAFTFTVSLDHAASTALLVDWWASGAGAHAAGAADFGGVMPWGTVTFAAGETTKTLTVLVSGDRTMEADEGFTVTLVNSYGGLAIGTGTASGTIVDDDTATVSIAATSVEHAEGNSGATSFAFTLTLTGDSSVGHTVAYAVTGTGSHPANAADFVGGTLPVGTVSFAAGETTKTLIIEIAGDHAVGADEGFSVTLSDPSTNLLIGTGSASSTVANDDMNVHDDGYVVLQGQALHIAAGAGVLTNDEGTVPTTAAVLEGPAHGTLALAADGSFDYTPTAGFVGIDSFTYRATGANGSGDAEVVIHVAPLSSAQTLGLLALTHEEQIGALYTGFLGRGADAAGFDYWIDKSESMSLTGIARSFAVSDEAKALHPFLANPQGAGDAGIGAFLDNIYDNLFGRAPDAAGATYWTSQIKQAVQAGMAAGDVVLAIIGGAQNSSTGQDITTLMGKVAVNLEYVHEQEGDATPWTAATDGASARALIDAVTADPHTVLVGIAHADRALLSE
jgi:hypothetical protein